MLLTKLEQKKRYFLSVPELLSRVIKETHKNLE